MTDTIFDPASAFLQKMAARAVGMDTKIEGNVLEVSDAEDKVSFIATSSIMQDDLHSLCVKVHYGEDEKTFVCVSDKKDFMLPSHQEVEERVARFALGLFWKSGVLKKLAVGSNKRGPANVSHINQHKKEK